MLKSMQPDIVLLDFLMPEMNGDAVLSELRKTDWGKDMKVIILTNIGEQDVPENLKGMNVTAFVVKANMTPKQLAELVKSKLA
jgi:CheY-like chemotaxis protein